MITTITTAVTGILTAIAALIRPVTEGSGGAQAEVAWVSILALPVLGGVVAMGRRLIKKAR